MGLTQQRLEAGVDDSRQHGEVRVVVALHASLRVAVSHGIGFGVVAVADGSCHRSDDDHGVAVHVGEVHFGLLPIGWQSEGLHEVGDFGIGWVVVWVAHGKDTKGLGRD